MIKLKRSLQLTFLVLIFIPVAACNSSKFPIQDQKIESSNLITAQVYCIDNAMPMTTSGSYLMLYLCSSLPLDENLKLIKLVAKGPKGSWETTSFDFDVFAGKGTDGYTNNARKYDLSIGLPVEFELIFLTEDSGNEVHFYDTMDHVQVVY